MNPLLQNLLLVQAVLAGPQAPGPDAQVVWPLERTVAWEGRSSILTFGVDPGQEGCSLATTSSDPSVLEVRESATVLPGTTSGSVRVHGIRAGEATLHVGGAPIVVQVSPLIAEAPMWRGAPGIVTPVQSAWSSGVVCVGVEVPTVGSSPPELELLLPDGSTRAPDALWHSPGVPTLRARFDVDTSRMPAGEHQMVLRSRNEEGEVLEARAPLGVTRGPVLAAGECEETLEQAGGLVGARPRIGADGHASGGRFVVLPRNDVLWSTSVTVQEHGRYQFLVRARGTFAAGAYPSLALAVGGSSPVHGTTRLVDAGWQRLPVGAPIELAPGEHQLVLRLLNDLELGWRSDRELFVDSWELVRVEEDGIASSNSMMMMEDGPSSELRGPRGPRGPGLWIGLERPLDGLEMNGRLTIEGAVHWSGAAAPAPEVELVVDGRVLSRQQSARPLFAVDRAHLGTGEHELWLRASLPDGRSARTPVQHVTVKGSLPVGIAPRDLHRFDVLDERWDGNVASWLDGEGEEERQRVLRPRHSLQCELTLPEDLAGTFELLLEARAGARERPARVSAKLLYPGREPGSELGAQVHDWWRLFELGQLDLEAGPKRIQLRLEPFEDDRELRVRSLSLRSVGAVEDHHPPTAELLYPLPGHAAHGVDMAVVRAFDDDALAGIDVLIDGRVQGTHGQVPEGAGHLTAPILLRDLAPGVHELSVRVWDRAGNLAETAPIPLRVLDGAPAERGPYARAVRLLNRVALGPDPQELAQLLVLGEQDWLEQCLHGGGSGDRTALERAEARNGDAVAYDAPRLALTHVLRSDNPVRARFALWVDDHFSTWAGKTGMPTEWSEYLDIARLGFAPFEEHLRRSATSASMLTYLDQAVSYSGRINENYARELLELHTVGVDAGYAQEDVGNLAHLLTGLTVSQEAPADGSGAYQRQQVRYDPELSDGRPCTLLSRSFPRSTASGRFDRLEQVLELLARRPETARHVARKLAEHYVATPAPEDLVDALATTFLESGGDPRALLRRLVAHPAFWEAEERLADPLEYGLRLARAVGLPQVDWTLHQFLVNSGMGLFDRVTPDGYPDDDGTWADTNGLMQRWRWVQRIPWAVRRLVPDGLRRDVAGDPHAWRQRVVDHAAVRLTGNLLGEVSNAAALEFLSADEAPIWQRVDNLCELICRLPEASLE